MDPGAPNPLLRSFERHLRAENRSAQTVATYLIALRQAETFLAATPGAPPSPPPTGPTWSTSRSPTSTWTWTCQPLSRGLRLTRRCGR
jgi:hypothetical protein